MRQSPLNEDAGLLNSASTLAGDLPRLARRTDLVLEAMEKHHLVDRIVEHHSEDEETEMFKVARQVFSKEELEELGSRLEATKAEQMQDAMPERDQIEL
jgi:hypothetical protein